MHSPVIEENHLLDTADLKDSSQQLVSMISILNTNPRFRETAPLQISQPNMLWEVRRNKTASLAETTMQPMSLGQHIVGSDEEKAAESTTGTQIPIGDEPGRLSPILKENEGSETQESNAKPADNSITTNLITSKEVGPPGQQPSLQWISDHPTTSRPAPPH